MFQANKISMLFWFWEYAIQTKCGHVIIVCAIIIYWVLKKFYREIIKVGHMENNMNLMIKSIFYLFFLDCSINTRVYLGRKHFLPGSETLSNTFQLSLCPHRYFLDQLKNLDIWTSLDALKKNFPPNRSIELASFPLHHSLAQPWSSLWA